MIHKSGTEMHGQSYRHPHCHYDRRRPHRALQLRHPRCDRPAVDLTHERIKRRPVLGGLITGSLDHAVEGVDVLDAPPASAAETRPAPIAAGSPTQARPLVARKTSSRRPVRASQHPSVLVVGGHLRRRCGGVRPPVAPWRGAGRPGGRTEVDALTLHRPVVPRYYGGPKIGPRYHKSSTART